jgi:glycosyltransferase involved in cell wall biosynthesis
MKNIIIIAFDFYPICSGLANVALAHSQLLVKNGYSVTVVSSMLAILKNPLITNKELPFNEVLDNISIIRIPYPKKGYLKSIVYIIRVLAEIGKMHPKPDLLFGIGLVPMGTISGIAGKLFKLKSMTSSYGSDIDQCFSIYDRVMRWITLKTCTILCAANKAHKEIMITKSGRKEIYHLPTPIPENKIEESKSKIKQKIGFDKKYFHLVTAGRLVSSRHGHIKGIIYILEALISLPQCKLHIIGSGPLLPEYKVFVKINKLNSRVEFKEFLPRNLYCEYLFASDVFLQPSLHEGLPLSMVEAMFYKTPMIVTPVGGMKDYIIDHENGLLVDVKSAQSILRAVQELIEDPPLQINLAEKAYQTYSKCFSEQAIIAHFNEFFLD